MTAPLESYRPPGWVTLNQAARSAGIAARFAARLSCWRDGPVRVVKVHDVVSTREVCVPAVIVDAMVREYAASRGSSGGRRGQRPTYHLADIRKAQAIVSQWAAGLPLGVHDLTPTRVDGQVYDETERSQR